MPRHVDLTANVERTPEELHHVGCSIDEINAVVGGYPSLHDRLYIPPGVQIPGRQAAVRGHMYEIPGGHDATGSSMRQETLDSISPEDFLLGTPDPDLVTGAQWEDSMFAEGVERKDDTWALPHDHPAVVRAIGDRCRDFTQHMQPLVPGWRQLLSLTTKKGQPRGMPTGIGWYTHLWLSDMCDAVTMRLSEAGDDVETLLYERSPDNQSEWVWATPGGYVTRADIAPEVTPLQAASARRTQFWTERDVSAHQGVPLRVKYPVSSGNTLVAGLRTTPFARFIASPDYRAEPRLTSRHERSLPIGRAAGFVSVRSLCDNNPLGGVSGRGHGDNPFPIWTTHFEYVTAGLEALTDAENQYRFGMSSRQFAQVRGVIDDLQSVYPALQST